MICHAVVATGSGHRPSRLGATTCISAAGAARVGERVERALHGPGALGVREDRRQTLAGEPLADRVEERGRRVGCHLDEHEAPRERPAGELLGGSVQREDRTDLGGEGELELHARLREL